MKKASRAVAVVLTLGVLVVLFFNFMWPSLAPTFTPNNGVVFSSGNTSHGKLGANAVDFSTPILRESRTKSDLVVYEQDVESTNTVTSTPMNIDIFKKSTTVHSFGTGVYTVNLTSVTADSITVNEDTKTVTVAIPHACLQYITEDLNRTSFEQTERGLLAFGDLTLTQEQQNALKQEIYNQMIIELTSESCYAAADLHALEAVKDLLQSVVDNVDSSYKLTITFDPETTNKNLSVPDLD
ncbi:MAG: DUF4230 domain-containing protein [Coriobacteriales bacterium]|nr:DUF4230 domain-containing protein [Coriobacteriales bacterium]